MLESHINYTSLIHGLIFLTMSLFLVWKTRNTITSTFRNIFWAFTAFSIMKAMSILVGLSIGFFPLLDDKLLLNRMLPEFFSTLSLTSSGISNIFLFHFGISTLTFKTSLRINYNIFPVLLFLAYMSLHLSGIVEPQDAERISRYSFGFNGAFLGSIGCFNLYYIKKTSIEKRLLAGLIICGIALPFYSFTEEVITNPVFSTHVELLRLSTAIALLVSSFFFIYLLKEDKGGRIGFI